MGIHTKRNRKKKKKTKAKNNQKFWSLKKKVYFCQK